MGVGSAVEMTPSDAVFACLCCFWGVVSSF